MVNDDQKPNITSEEKAEALARKLKDIGRERTEVETLVTARDEGLNYIELSKYPISQSALSILSREDADKARAICFVRSAEGLSVATVDPTTDAFIALVKDLKERFNQPVFVSLISEPTFQEVFRQYEALPAYTPPPPGVEIGAESIGKFRDTVKDFKALDEKLRGVSTTDMVAFILAAALDSRASDVHLEPTEADAKVRFRIDGALYTTASLALDNFQKVLTRIKLASHLKINVNDVPQDGHFVITVPDDRIDVRVSTVPAASGESVAMRILRSSAAGLKLDDLGLRGAAYDTALREVDRPTGMIISCGPTGSGKTTLLYAMLQRRNNSETKIITMEDPIEYRVEGLTQTQVSPDEGYTFAKGLKASLRQDPDVIMVGEIRDLETGDTAINAALTGHLVFSTLHTNSAAASVARFLALGVKPFLLAPALNVLIGQRLVRRLCEKCKKEKELDATTLERVKEIIAGLPKTDEFKDIAEKPLTFYEGGGCEACQGIGYKGRIGLFEVLVVDDAMKGIVGKQGEAVDTKQIEDAARAAGMVTLVEDGILKAMDGITSVDEVFKVAEE